MATLSRTFIRQLVTDTIRTYGSEDVEVYRLESIAPDIYRQGSRSYYDAVTIKAHVRTENDEEMLTRIGGLNQDEIAVVISIDELEDTLVVAGLDADILKTDILSVRGTMYSVILVMTYGAMLGGPNMICAKCKEYPDSPV